MRPTHALLLPLLAFTPACFISRDTINEPLVQKQVAELVPGRSTAAEATAMLGSPHEVVQLGARTAYRYDFTTTKRAGFSIIIVSFLNQDTRQDRVWLFFDAHDVLTHVGSTMEAADAEYAMPWMEIHDD